MTQFYPAGEPLHPDHLKHKQRELRDGFPLALTLRVHRSLSWLRRATKEDDDLDVRFILLWIGFNAAYAGDLDRALGEAANRSTSSGGSKAFSPPWSNSTPPIASTT